VIYSNQAEKITSKRPFRKAGRAACALPYPETGTDATEEEKKMQEPKNKQQPTIYNVTDRDGKILHTIRLTERKPAKAYLFLLPDIRRKRPEEALNNEARAYFDMAFNALDQLWMVDAAAAQAIEEDYGVGAAEDY